MRPIFSDDEFKEICFTLAVTFFPLLISAFVSFRIAEISFFKAFLGYFDSGELGLYILSTCGALAFILFIKTRFQVFGDNLWLFMICFLAPIIGAATVLGTNPQFSKSLPPEQHAFLIIIYFLSLWGWFKAMKIKKETDKKLKKAKKAMKGAKYASDEEAEAVKQIIGD